MNPRATIFLLVLTLLAVGGLFYLRHAVAPTREAAENKRYAAVFDAESVNEIDITRTDNLEPTLPAHPLAGGRRPR
ncbi:MAG: hypothetical protein ACKOD5_08490 [Chthoniobacterales bacterium]